MAEFKKATIKKDIANIIKLENNNKGHNPDYMVGLAGGEPVNVKKFKGTEYDYFGMLEDDIVYLKKEWLDF